MFAVHIVDVVNHVSPGRQYNFSNRDNATNTTSSHDDDNDKHQLWSNDHYLNQFWQSLWRHITSLHNNQTEGISSSKRRLFKLIGFPFAWAGYDNTKIFVAIPSLKPFYVRGVSCSINCAIYIPTKHSFSHHKEHGISSLARYRYYAFSANNLAIYVACVHGIHASICNIYTHMFYIIEL